MAGSPRIVSLSWGLITVEGLGVFKDLKVWPGGGRAWDWAETGTHHSPGIQVGDVHELLGHGVEVVVLGTGMEGALGVMPETLELLEGRGVEVRVLSAKEAVGVYNRLAESVAVGGLFHSTC